MKDLYHIYRDETYFSYEITITRDDEAAGNVGQKYIIYVSTRNSYPHIIRRIFPFWW